MRHLVFPSCAALAGMLLVTPIRARMPADQALQAMKPAEGVQVSLFASEPDLVNPTCIDVDVEGRVWVAEASNYRLYKNPLTRKKGDRIRVLEDTNGDGRCDKASTFYQDRSLQSPLGIAILGKRVYVCQSPDLFYLEDIDGDGAADKKTVVLTGFKGVDHDHAIHGIIFGPDGYLYMSNGDAGLDVTDKQGNRIRVGPDSPHKAASVLRTDLDGTRLELLAEGLRNPFEPAVDSLGNVFISDNDDDGNEQCRVVFVMEGGDYGYWPRRRGNRRLDEVHWNEDLPGVIPKILKTGFGSPTGLMFYEGSQLPPRFQRTLIHADAGPGVIRSYSLRPRGSGFSGDIQTILSCPGDKWFRPVDVAAAPDGSLFVADWYDPGVGGHNIGDFEKGRIYRLAAPGKDYRLSRIVVSDAASAAAALESPNQAVRFMAYQAFAGNQGDSDTLKSLWRQDKNEVLRARALWLLAAKGTAGLQSVLDATRDKSAGIRTQAVRILGMLGPEALSKAEWLVDDQDSAVRREVLLRLQQQKYRAAPWYPSWVLKLAEGFDGHDRFYREAIGIATRGKESFFFSKIAEKSGHIWNERLAQLALQLHPTLAVEMAASILADSARPTHERLGALQVVAAAGGDVAADRMIAQLTVNGPVSFVSGTLQMLRRDAGAAWPLVRRDQRLQSFLREALRSPALRDEAERMIRELRFSNFLPELLQTARDRAASLEARVSAIDTIRQLQSPAALEPMNSLLAGQPPRVAIAAARAIGALGTDDAYQVLGAVIRDRAKSLLLRKEIVRQLGGSRSGALLLLRLAEQGELPQDLISNASSVTNTSQHESVRLMAQRVLPLPASKSGQPIPPIPTLLRLKGDVARGRTVFFGSDGPQCARCHKIHGEGREVGPDLSLIGGKLPREGLLESILHPSAAIAHEYQVWLLRTKSRGLVDGYIRSESGGEVDLMDSNGNLTRIPAADILSRIKSSTSLMPTGLSSGMTTRQLVDLIEYLVTLK